MSVISFPHMRVDLTDRKKAKIMRKVKFPLQLDITDLVRTSGICSNVR